MTQPDPLPKPGDAVEVEHEGDWQDALVTEVTADRVMGVVTDSRVHNPTQFSYTLTSYRENWRWSQKMPLRVEMAAVQLQDGSVYSVPRPGRHDAVIIMIRDLFGKEWLEQQRSDGFTTGFVLSDGTFATRARSAQVAFAAGQLPKDTKCPSSLISEDLW